MQKLFLSLQFFVSDIIYQYRENQIPTITHNFNHSIGAIAIYKHCPALLDQHRRHSPAAAGHCGNSPLQSRFDSQCHPQHWPTRNRRPVID
jgi:hypothetical protein